MICNVDTSFVYFSLRDGLFALVPAEDYTGAPHDVSRSATLQGSEQVDDPPDLDVAR